MRILKALALLAALSLLLLAVLILRPVPLVPESECIVHTGVVEDVFESGVKDVTIRMDNTDKRFYINRGLEQGLVIDSLRATLVGRTATVKYPSYWTPLDPNDRVKHISKLEHGGEVIFSELKE